MNLNFLLLVQLQYAIFVALFSSEEVSSLSLARHGRHPIVKRADNISGRGFTFDLSWGSKKPSQNNMGNLENKDKGKPKNAKPAEEACLRVPPKELKMPSCPKNGSFPVKNQCRVFLTCFRSGMKPISSCCPKELSFDHRWRKCVQKSVARCKDVCAKKGKKFADPYNTKGYLECTDKGIPEEKECEPMYHYDVSNKTCKSNQAEMDRVAAELSPEVIEELMAGYEIPEMNKTADGEEGDKGKVVETKNSTNSNESLPGSGDAATNNNATMNTTSDSDSNNGVELNSGGELSGNADTTKEVETNSTKNATEESTGHVDATTAKTTIDVSPETPPSSKVDSEKSSGGAGGGDDDGDEELPEEDSDEEAAEEVVKPKGRSFGFGGGAKAGGTKDTHDDCSPNKGNRKAMETCPKPGEFPLKNECKLFLKCYAANKPPTFICCQAGLFFDHTLRKCVEEEDAQCQNLCPRAGKKFPDPNNLNGYLECNKKGVPEEVSCPDNHRFVEGNGTCVPSQTPTDSKDLLKSYELDDDTIKQLLSGIEFPSEDKNAVATNETQVPDEGAAEGDDATTSAEEPKQGASIEKDSTENDKGESGELSPSSENDKDGDPEAKSDENDVRNGTAAAAPETGGNADW